MQAFRAVVIRSRSVIPRARFAVASATRTMVSMHDRERAMEKAYFNKQEEGLLRKILKKMKDQADTGDADAAKAVQAKELSELQSIVGKYNVSEEDMKKLVDWRHSHEH